MEPFTTALITGGVSILTIASSLAFGKHLLNRAVERVQGYEVRAEEIIDARAHEALDFIERLRRQAAEAVTPESLAATLFAENASLEEMIQELREERDDLSGELASYKVDAVEQSRVADAYARQSTLSDEVIDHLTLQLHEAGQTIILPTHLAEAHAESLIRTGLKGLVGRGPGTIGRASDLAQAA